MNTSFLKQQIDKAIAQGTNYGISDVWKGSRVSVEFVSADPIGPLSMDRARIAVTGDALCRLLSWQNIQVTREYLINDDESSSRLQLLGESILAAYSNHYGESNAMPEGGLNTEFVGKVATDIARKKGNKYLSAPKKEAVHAFAEYACAQAIESQRNTLEALDVHFNLWVYESTLIKEGRMQAVIEKLRAEKALFEESGTLWLETTRWGDDANRALARSNDHPTYLAIDIAYHLFRLERGYDSLINVWSDEHRPYIKRTQAALEAAGVSKDALTVLLCAPLSWKQEEGALPEQLSEESADQALKIVGKTRFRLAVLLAEQKKALKLDEEALLLDDDKNPVSLLLQLPSHLLRAQQQASGNPPEIATWSKNEAELAHWIAVWPDQVKTATEQLSSKLIALHLQEGARLINQLLQSPSENAWSAPLLQAATRVTHNALTILGVTIPAQF